MQRRNREINIFSMSALDLFASGMGAFILIAILLFPYFPHTGDSADTEALKVALDDANAATEEQAAAVEALQAQLAEALRLLAEKPEPTPPTPVPPVPIPVPEPKPLPGAKTQFPDIDLVLVLDVTGSMGSALNALKREIVSFVRVTDKLSSSIGIGIVAYGDRQYRTPVTVQPLLKISDSPANFKRLKRFVDALELRHGIGKGRNDDTPEALFAGLKQAVNSRWRKEVEQRMIVIITDAPGYPEERMATLKLARNFVSSKKSRISVLFVDTDESVPLDLKELAREGKGNVVEGGTSLTSGILQAILID
ncbi:VWA domain-containing protein [Corallincola holothuriorum]|uniref:VWA domain-containing protein n=1 Tax=Corallincola holothuriorum TaxID=2282215 RepID=A0A368NJZ2_9GAMM|nr:vWA domain-containing protein [Corallincola holothuriorum]RCU50922.1 VWA domain-containing protein [Corallincola holothuriorum]